MKTIRNLAALVLEKDEPMIIKIILIVVLIIIGAFSLILLGLPKDQR